jgi:sugar lactone lactonase YvrE
VKYHGWLVGLLLVVLALSAAMASAQLAWDPKEFMGVEEIAPGMVGYGKTVYQGTKVEKFDIEVIGVLKKVDFGFDMILVKVTSGPVVDRKLQTVAGMSGSPIYIDDRLIGAYAYGWDFQQEAIAGVTPIANMLECTQPGSVTPPLVGALAPKSKVLTIGTRKITRVEVAATLGDAQRQQAAADPTTMVLAPAATPIFANGLSDKSLAPLQKFFDRYNVHVMQGPGPGGAADGPAPKLEAGSAVAVSLMEGDANLSAVGTVTYVKGDTVLAFGHPMFGLGKIDMPMDVAYVHGIINSSWSSFKMASPIARVGTATSDRAYALAGQVGKEPNTLPIGMYLTDASRNFTRRYQIDMMNSPDFTPFLLYIYVLMNGAGQLANVGWDEGTFSMRAVVSTDKLGDIEQKLDFAPQAGASSLPLGELVFLADSLMQNPYERVTVKKVFMDIKYAPERNTASIEKITPDRPVARPGETVNITVKIRPYGKPVETQKVSVKVPAYASEPAMAVVVAGGTQAFALKPLVAPLPNAEEGVRGMVRWLTDNPTAKSVLTAQVFPSPSYGFRGRMLSDVPMPLLDLLMLSEYAGGMPRMHMGGGRNENANDAPNAALRPSTYLTVAPEPYVLTGGQAVLIAIETEEKAVHSRQGEFDFGVQMPILSMSDTPGAGNPGDDGSENKYESTFAAAPWFSPAQRARHAILFDAMRTTAPRMTLPTLPAFRYPQTRAFHPLSVAPYAPKQNEEVEVEATPEAPDPEMDNEDAEEPGEEPQGEEVHGGKPKGTMPASARPSWGLTNRNDFLRGKHLGTSVTSRGRLVLAPKVQAIYTTTDVIPWKMVTTPVGTYVAGWGSALVTRLTGDGTGETVFPKATLPNVTAVTGLAGDTAGNLLVATWPDQHVRLVKSDGTVLKDWQLPGTAIWDLAIASDGKRYAACDGGALYILRDDDAIPLQVGCNVPDKHVFALTAGNNGDVYLATSPRGKVYRLSKQGVLQSVYEARGAVISLAVDKADNVYVGTSPLCRVYRVSPDGTKKELMRGMGRGNRHVLALKMVGDDLYASTGPAGGIYRITDPAGQEPEVTPVFAREDQRAGEDETDETGPESLMVNALAVDAKGQLLAATSSPGQVLQLQLRAQGAFLSSVLQTPVVARWGQIDVHISGKPGASIESRSGQTAVPDATWSKWEAISTDGAELASAPATFAQFRVRLSGSVEKSPALEYVRLYYQPVNQTPVVRLETPKPGIFLSGTKEIRWDAKDPDGDELVYAAFFSRDDGQTWLQLTRTAPPPPPTPVSAPTKGKKGKAAPAPAPAPAPKPDNDIREKNIPWDTKSVPDGTYRIKVVATDKYAKPTDPKSAEVISGRFTVDNSAPAVTIGDKVYGWLKLAQLEVVDNLTPLTGGRFRIDDGPWVALTPVSGIFKNRKETVKLLLPDGEPQFTAGEHKVTIQVKDSAENQLERTITLLIGQKEPPAKAELDYPEIRDGNDKNLADLMLYNLQPDKK